MPPSPKFTRPRLRDAALEIVDAWGLEALSMRSLASALGTGPMTLYNYVQSRDELDALVVEGVMAGYRDAIRQRAQQKSPPASST